MSLTNLPPELHHLILSHLSPPCLLAYGLTCRANYALHGPSLTALTLGVFHSRISSLISFLHLSSAAAATSSGCCGGYTSSLSSPSSSSSSSTSHSVCVLLKKRESRSRVVVTARQNAIVSSVLRRYKYIQTLDLLLWDLKSCTTLAISGLYALRSLTIRLDHPYIRHPDLPKTHWETCVPGTLWNWLSSALAPPHGSDGGRKRKPMGGVLQSVHLERCGITDYQLECLLADHPHIHTIHLQKCLILTEELFEALTRSAFLPSTLKVLVFTDSSSEGINERIYPYISELKALKVLDLHNCTNLRNEDVKHWNETVWGIPEVRLPHEGEGAGAAAALGGRRIEVDEEYK
ncbi:MAG: hypothetical protein M1840_001640 [Geoglossum simile]|nr:MAG: hypothetical protein M1840_001640 [Geoglossum simile]